MKEVEVSAERWEESGEITEGLMKTTDQLSPETEEPAQQMEEEKMRALLQRMKEIEEADRRIDDEKLLAYLRAIDRASRPTLWDRITGAWKRKQYGRKLTEKEKGIMYDLMMSRIYPVR